MKKQQGGSQRGWWRLFVVVLLLGGGIGALFSWRGGCFSQKKSSRSRPSYRALSLSSPAPRRPLATPQTRRPSSSDPPPRRTVSRRTTPRTVSASPDPAPRDPDPQDPQEEKKVNCVPFWLGNTNTGCGGQTPVIPPECRFLKEDKKKAKNFASRGHWLVDEGEYKKARHAYIQAIRHDSTHAAAYRALGITLATLGSCRYPKSEKYNRKFCVQAAHLYEKYITLKPQAREAPRIRKMLQRFWGTE